MKRILTLTALLVVVMANAQLPTDFRSEQIYLSLQQTEWLPGDTLLLEGQVTSMASDRFLPYSNYLYIECFNGQDSVLVRQKVSCKDKGYFSTHLPTEYEWPAGVYYLRAYTRLMQNFSPESFAQQPFLLAKEFPERESQIYEARCTIIPSGGKLVANHPQTVVVQLTDECTFPISAKLQLMSEKGDTLGFVQTSASGLAQISFIPALNTSYHLVGNIDGRDYRFPLPGATQDIKVQGSLNGKRLNYQILNAQGKGNILYTYDRINGLTRTNIERTNGILMLDKAPETLSLFLTDTNNRILSEYTLSGKHVRNGRIQLPDTIKINETIRYELPELAKGSRIITRMVAENELLAASAEKSLKYLADYHSLLPFPRHLYAADDAEYNRDLHAWLSTTKFQRFNLAEALVKDTAIYVHAPEQVLAFSGKIEKTNDRPMKDGQLVAYHTFNNFVYDVSLAGDSARFTVTVEDFEDGEEFFLQAITPKGKPDFANYLVDEEKYPALQNNRRFRLPVSRYADSEVIAGNTFNLDYSVDKNNERNYTLPNVTVKARLRTEKAKSTNEFYSVNYADRKEIEEKGYLTLADILKDMPGVETSRQTVQVVSPDGKSAHYETVWIVESTRGASLLGGSAALPILLDGTRMDEYDFIMEMPASEIETVELLRGWQAIKYTFGAINGAILVKSIDYKKREPLPSKGAIYTPTGLSPLSHPYKELALPSLKADNPGRYRLLVDVFTDTGVQSYEHLFEVVE